MRNESALQVPRANLCGCVLVRRRAQLLQFWWSLGGDYCEELATIDAVTRFIKSCRDQMRGHREERGVHKAPPSALH